MGNCINYINANWNIYILSKQFIFLFIFSSALFYFCYTTRTTKTNSKNNNQVAIVSYYSGLGSDNESTSVARLQTIPDYDKDLTLYAWMSLLLACVCVRARVFILRGVRSYNGSCWCSSICNSSSRRRNSTIIKTTVQSTKHSMHLLKPIVKMVTVLVNS